MTYYHMYTEFNEGYDATETTSLGFFSGYPSVAQVADLVQYRGLTDKQIERLHSTQNLSQDSTLHYFIEEISVLIGEG